MLPPGTLVRLPRISAGPGTVSEATHKSTLNLLARRLRPKMALEDTLWIYYGESGTAQLADLRTIIPRHIQRAVGPSTVYAVVSAASPICSDFQTFCPDWLHFGHFLCFGGIAASQLSHRIFPIYF